MPFKKLRRQGKLNCRQASAHSSFAEMAAALGLRLVKQTPTRMISSHWSKGFYDRNRYPLPGWQAPETKKKRRPSPKAETARNRYVVRARHPGGARPVARQAVRRIVRLAGREERQAECGEGGVCNAVKRAASTTSTEDYATWRLGVAAELQRQHGIAFDIIPEEGWMRLYVKGLSPEQAASADEIRKYYAREPAPHVRRQLGPSG